MAQNITLLGASYTGVPGVELPKTGGGTALFADPSVTTAVEADVAQGKVFLKADGSTGTGTATGGGGSGATNIVQGTFTTGSTRASRGTVTIPYTGSGYPIALMIYVDGGAYNNTTGGNTTWYNAVSRYDVGAYYMTKSRITTEPGYVTNNAYDSEGVACVIYKNSASTATTYSPTSSMAATAYKDTTSSTAGKGASCACFAGNGTNLSYYIGNNGSSSIGFAPSTKYAYIAIYSS